MVGQIDTLPTQIDITELDMMGEGDSAAPATTATPESTPRENGFAVTDFDGSQTNSVESLPAVEHVAEESSPVEPKVAPPVLSELKSDLGSSTELREQQENTVRVPIKDLDRLNDFFGELTIARNGLNLYVERLRNLVRILGRRVRTLRRFDIRLRTAYDKIFTKADLGSAAASSPEIKSEPEEDTPQINSWEMGGDDLYLLSQELAETVTRINEVTEDIELSLEDTERTVSELNRTAKQLQMSLNQVRMRPLSDLVGRFPRALRDLSLQYGKNVELKVHGGGTLVDRTILEALGDPLLHLIRNAFDHGIEEKAVRQALNKPEQGLIEIGGVTRGNQILITVRDDGRGIDLERVRIQAQNLGLDPSALDAASDEELLTLIFEPGFSTADRVTALSGRGVGLDVVRTNLRQIRGDIKVKTQPGVGTTFTLSVPLTLSVARVLLVESKGMLLAFPTDAIEEMLLLNPEQVFKVAGKEVLNWEGTMAPLVRLDRWLNFRCPQIRVDAEATPLMSAPTVLMISKGNELVGIQVNRCWGEQEVAIRQVEGTIAMPPGLNGCTILGDGRVVPLVNASELLHWIASYEHSYNSQPEDEIPVPVQPDNQKDTILVVDDSINVRRLLSLTLERAGYHVEQAKDGQDAFDKLTNGLDVAAVICDIDMPRLDGYGLLARVKSTPGFKQLPIAMLTSRGGDKDRQLAMNLGATAYFSKPYNEQELLKTLKQLI
jgi:chemotaxis family two-component system sensor histidine kinase/response regulator PixL